MDLEQILENYDITEDELKKLLKANQKSNPYEKKTSTIKTGKHTKFGVVSDLHIGHNKFREDILDHARRRFNQEHIEFILMPGDILEGMSGREGHIYELSHIGATNQLNYATQLLNQFNQPMYGITATNSHDGWYHSKNNAGLEIGPELESRIKNFKFMGYDEVDLEVNEGIKLRMTHPGDGTAYALCFDKETEILTEDGWKLFKDLNKSEKVATLNLKNDEFQWQKPTAYTDEAYNGELIHFKSRTIDLMVTPNHRLLVRRYPNNLLQSRKPFLKFPFKSHRLINFDWTIKTAKELVDCKRQEWQMKRASSNWKGELIEKIEIPHLTSKSKGMIKRMKHIGEISIEDIAELIAWYVTEGSIRKTSIDISQCEKANPLNHYQIIDLLERIGLKVKTTGRNNKDIMVYSKELADWLISECGSGSRNKYLPKWLKNQPQEILKIVFDTMIKGDGWINHKGFGYKSISKQLLSDMSEISSKLGYATTKNKDSLSISSEQIQPTINQKPEIINYKDRIYCVSVPNSIILVRRKGKAIWSGNSYKMQKYLNSLSGGTKPHAVFQGHYHKAMYMFYRNVHGFESGTICDQTIFMKKKQTPAMTGYWIVDMWGNDHIDRLKHEFVAFYD